MKPGDIVVFYPLRLPRRTYYYVQKNVKRSGFAVMVNAVVVDSADRELAVRLTARLADGLGRKASMFVVGQMPSADRKALGPLAERLRGRPLSGPLPAKPRKLRRRAVEGKAIRRGPLTRLLGRRKRAK